MTARQEVIFEALPMRVRLRDGAVEDLAEELQHLGLRRPLVLSTPGHERLARTAEELLGSACAGVFAGARMHVPADVVADALDVARRSGADSYVAIGGGSTIGLAKALALDAALPIVAVPTTYAGSEMTPVWGITDGGVKRTGRDRKVLPVSVIYDPELTMSLPAEVTVTSGLNAVAHAMESLYAPDTSPIVSVMATRGVALFASALPVLHGSPEDPTARRDAIEAAWLCGAVLGLTTMGLHHKLCHVLGGTFDLPHAATHATILPFVADFNLPSAPNARRALGDALRTADPVNALFELNAALGVPKGLGKLGIGPGDVDRIVSEVLSRPYANPAPVSDAGLRALLHTAIAGR